MVSKRFDVLYFKACSGLSVTALLGSLYFGGCASSESLVAEPVTGIPEDFSGVHSVEGVGVVVLPGEALDVYRVSRRQAELRNGPGTKFEIQDKILVRDVRVVLLDQHEVWRKVVSLDERDKGWVHYRALEKIEGIDQVQLDLEKMPLVSAVRQVEKVFSYGDIEKIPVNIPKGTAFVALKNHEWRVLVWLPRSKALAWVSRKDFQ